MGPCFVLAQPTYWGSQIFLSVVLQKCLQVILLKRNNRSLRLSRRSFVCFCFLKGRWQLENKRIKRFGWTDCGDGQAPSLGKEGRRPAARSVDWKPGPYLTCRASASARRADDAFRGASQLLLRPPAPFTGFCSRRRRSARAWINLTGFLFFVLVFKRRMSNWSTRPWVYFYSINLLKGNCLHLFLGRFQEGVFIPHY